MKKLLYGILPALIFSFQAHCAEPTFTEEVQSFGYLSGLGLACQASKYDSFELIARAFLVSKSRSDDEQEEAMKAYNDAKADAFISKIKDKMAGCHQIADVFDNQKIFKAVLYGDGTLKMPDGKLIKPRHAYDATLVYQKDPDARERMIEMYEREHKKIINDPAYQKALRERQAKDGF